LQQRYPSTLLRDVRVRQCKFKEVMFPSTFSGFYKEDYLIYKPFLASISCSDMLWLRIGNAITPAFTKPKQSFHYKKNYNAPTEAIALQFKKFTSLFKKLNSDA
jgi:hypothetical protein